MALPRDPAPPGADAAALNEPIPIPHAELSADALRGVIESFVLREGTDYGEREHSFEQKVAQVRAQLERGQARILFDPETNTVTLALVRP
ncbi:MAG TPA: YheU family protein [Steroidobacteraceae bacterium]|nr:YheU family protein [Steroidobacteraceae bacterium]